MYSIDNEVHKSFSGPVPAKKKEGFVCSCEKGSPRPGYVILVPDLHDKNCHVRKKIVGRRP